MHESLDKFEIWPDLTTDYGLAALERMKKSHRLIIGNTTSSHFRRYLTGSFSFCR